MDGGIMSTSMALSSGYVGESHSYWFPSGPVPKQQVTPRPWTARLECSFHAKKPPGGASLVQDGMCVPKRALDRSPISLSSISRPRGCHAEFHKIPFSVGKQPLQAEPYLIEEIFRSACLL